jgi:hypothetical protein
MRIVVPILFVGCLSPNAAPEAESLEQEPIAPASGSETNGSSGGGGGGRTATGEPATETPVEPASEDTAVSSEESLEGYWLYGGGELLENNCPEMDDSSTGEVEATGFTLSMLSETEFSMLMDGASDPFLCELIGSDFSCTPVTVYESFDYSESGWLFSIEITIGITTSYTGSFLSENRLYSEYQLDVVCDDVELSDCGEVPQLPCVVRFSAEAEK